MSTTPGKENIVVALNPVQLSPAKVLESSHGLAFDVLIKPASANKKLKSMYSPSPKDCNEKLKSAEKRKDSMDKETQEKLREKHEKVKAAKSYVLESIENHQKQTVQILQKKELTAEELIINRKKELEDKRIAREQRALEAKKQHEEILESKRKHAELQLAQLKLADQLREANHQAITEKAKKELDKVAEVTQKKKSGDLDEQIRNDLQSGEETRLEQLNCLMEK